MSKRISPSFLVALAALIIAGSGTSYAAGKITGRQIANNAIVSKHVKDGSLGTNDLSSAARNALQGAAGATGPAGQSGPAGAKGETGATGDVGPKGDTGPQGVRGLSGPAGPKGDTGAKGDTGPQGQQGLQGAPGSSGVLGVVTFDAPDTVAGLATTTFWSQGCPTGKALISWALGSTVDTTDLTVKNVKYANNSVPPNLPWKVGVTIYNASANSRSVTITTICASAT